MRSDESAALSRPPQRMYDADEVDSYVGFLLCTVEDLRAQDRLVTRAELAPAPITACADAEVVLGQILLEAEGNADDIMSAAYHEAGAIRARAASQSEACMADARIEADRLVVEARRAIESFLQTWDDQLCDHVSDARRRMFGGFGRSTGPRRMAGADLSQDEPRYGVTIESRLQVRVRGRSRHRGAGAAHNSSAGASGVLVMQRSANSGS